MTDPRKPIKHALDDRGDIVRDIVHGHLIECTGHGTRALGCSGASFVTMGMGLWAAELAELDGKASAAFLRSLADIVDPASKPPARIRAEEYRKCAVRKLMVAVDLMMNPSEGRS